MTTSPPVGKSESTQKRVSRMGITVQRSQSPLSRQTTGPDVPPVKATTNLSPKNVLSSSSPLLLTTPAAAPTPVLQPDAPNPRSGVVTKLGALMRRNSSSVSLASVHNSDAASINTTGSAESTASRLSKVRASATKLATKFAAAVKRRPPATPAVKDTDTDAGASPLTPPRVIKAKGAPAEAVVQNPKPKLIARLVGGMLNGTPSPLGFTKPVTASALPLSEVVDVTVPPTADDLRSAIPIPIPHELAHEDDTLADVSAEVPEISATPQLTVEPEEEVSKSVVGSAYKCVSLIPGVSSNATDQIDRVSVPDPFSEGDFPRSLTPFYDQHLNELLASKAAAIDRDTRPVSPFEGAGLSSNAQEHRKEHSSNVILASSIPIHEGVIEQPTSPLNNNSLPTKLPSADDAEESVIKRPNSPLKEVVLLSEVTKNLGGPVPTSPTHSGETQSDQPITVFNKSLEVLADVPGWTKPTSPDLPSCAVLPNGPDMPANNSKQDLTDGDPLADPVPAQLDVTLLKERDDSWTLVKLHHDDEPGIQVDVHVEVDQASNSQATTHVQPSTVAATSVTSPASETFTVQTDIVQQVVALPDTGDLGSQAISPTPPSLPPCPQTPPVPLTSTKSTVTPTLCSAASAQSHPLAQGKADDVAEYGASTLALISNENLTGGTSSRDSTQGSALTPTANPVLTNMTSSTTGQRTTQGTVDQMIAIAAPKPTASPRTVGKKAIPPTPPSLPPCPQTPPAPLTATKSTVAPTLRSAASPHPLAQSKAEDAEEYGASALASVSNENLTRGTSIRSSRQGSALPTANSTSTSTTSSTIGQRTTQGTVDQMIANAAPKPTASPRTVGKKAISPAPPSLPPCPQTPPASLTATRSTVTQSTVAPTLRSAASPQSHPLAQRKAEDVAEHGALASVSNENLTRGTSSRSSRQGSALIGPTANPTSTNTTSSTTDQRTTQDTVDQIIAKATMHVQSSTTSVQTSPAIETFSVQIDSAKQLAPVIPDTRDLGAQAVPPTPLPTSAPPSLPLHPQTPPAPLTATRTTVTQSTVTPTLRSAASAHPLAQGKAEDAAEYGASALASVSNENKFTRGTSIRSSRQGSALTGPTAKPTSTNTPSSTIGQCTTQGTVDQMVAVVMPKPTARSQTVGKKAISPTPPSLPPCPQTPPAPLTATKSTVTPSTVAPTLRSAASPQSHPLAQSKAEDVAEYGALASLSNENLTRGTGSQSSRQGSALEPTANPTSTNTTSSAIGQCTTQGTVDQMIAIAVPKSTARPQTVRKKRTAVWKKRRAVWKKRTAVWKKRTAVWKKRTAVWKKRTARVQTFGKPTTTPRTRKAMPGPQTVVQKPKTGPQQSSTGRQTTGLTTRQLIFMRVIIGAGMIGVGVIGAVMIGVGVMIATA